MEETTDEAPSTSRTRICSAVVLCFTNIMSYSDRFVVAVLIPDIKEEFSIDNGKMGLLHTATFLLYAAALPVFGYLGDRYSRKKLIAVSVFLWNTTNLTSSFMTTYWSFFTMRTIFGMGHAGYVTISPIVIGDLFIGTVRSKALSIFYFAIPIGMGSGYILGKQIQILFSWRWSFRIPPMIGAINLVLVCLILKEPIRGELEGKVFSQSLLVEDIHYLSKNVTYILSTIAFTCIAFTAQAVCLWGPHLFNLGFQILDKSTDLDLMNTIFGVIVMFSGILGLLLGYICSSRLINKWPNINPVICGTSLSLAGPFLIGSTFIATRHLVGCLICIFIGLIFLSSNWAIVVDIMMKVVLPCKRTFALSFQIFLGTAFGSLLSPYLVGRLSVYLEEVEMATEKDWNQFKSLQYAFFVSCLFCAVAAILYAVMSIYYLRDVKRVESARNKYGDT